MRISDWSSDVCSSDLEDDAFDAHASIVAGGNRQRIDSRARAQRVEQGGLHGKAALAVARQVPERNAERYRQQKEGRSKDAHLPQRLTRTVLTAEPIAAGDHRDGEGDRLHVGHEPPATAEERPPIPTTKAKADTA